MVMVKKTVVTAHEKRIKTIIEFSKLRQDNLHVELENAIDNDKDFTVKRHSRCVSTYTSKQKLKRKLD